MSPRANCAPLLRLGTRASAFALALVLAGEALPARAGEPAAPKEPRRRDTSGGLLLLSFLVPLAVPMAFVAPVATRPPPAARAGAAPNGPSTRTVTSAPSARTVPSGPGTPAAPVDRAGAATPAATARR